MELLKANQIDPIFDRLKENTHFHTQEVIKFDTQEFIKHFSEVESDLYKKIVDEYGEGGKGGGVYYSANSYIGKSLSKYKNGKYSLKKLSGEEAPDGWGNKIITLWEFELLHNSENKVEVDLQNILSNTTIQTTERQQLINNRIGQGDFRKKLIEFWKKCAVTGCKETKLLVASHIKPWAVSDNKERLDVYNGLLLIPNLDQLFDQGFISFDKNGKIFISPSLSKETQQLFGVEPNKKIKLSEEHEKYMSYHRENIFRNK